MGNPDWMRDELILALELYVRHGRRQLDATHPDVSVLSRLLKQLPLHASALRGPNFRNPNGVAMKLGNFTAVDPAYDGAGLIRGGRLDREVFEEFAHDSYRLYAVAELIRQAVKEPEPNFDYETGEEDFPEGRLLTRRHLIRERNPLIVRRKKEQVLKRTGQLKCECCEFDFERHYGPLGQGFAECHHTQPIASLSAGHRSKLKDLAIVCANCHRMLHRARPMISVEELKQRLLR